MSEHLLVERVGWASRSVHFSNSDLADLGRQGSTASLSTVSSLVSTDDSLRRPVPPRGVEQSLEPRGVKRGQVGVEPDQDIETGQSLTVAESELCGHVGWVQVQQHAVEPDSELIPI